MDNLIKIFSQFKIDSKVLSIKPFGSGHINDTYKVETDEKNYLLQRINHEIFKNVEGLTANIIKVTEFLQEKIQGDHSDNQLLISNKTKSGEYVHRDEQGNYWRVFDFVENSKSFDLVENAELAFEGGKAYGWFVRMLADFPVNELVETIPDFHNADFRINNFRKAVKNDLAGRVAEVKGLISELEHRTQKMKKIQLLGEQGIIPTRVTHNDTKINNVLFNENNKGMCVIDLDTVMPGYVHFDFGDAIRTFTNTGDEDAIDLDGIEMNFEYFKALTTGFLSEAGDVLNKEEINTLAFSGKYIVFEQSARFLTDYLNGDVYYKTDYPNHNLVRTKAQVKLLQSIERQFDEMHLFVTKCSHKF